MLKQTSDYVLYSNESVENRHCVYSILEYNFHIPKFPNQNKVFFLINRSDWLLFFEYEYKLMLKYFITIRLTDVSLRLTDVSLRLTDVSLRLTDVSLRLTYVSLRLTYVSLIQLDKQNKTQPNK
jgi:hypothetical protein